MFSIPDSTNAQGLLTQMSEVVDEYNLLVSKPHTILFNLRLYDINKRFLTLTKLKSRLFFTEIQKQEFIKITNRYKTCLLHNNVVGNASEFDNQQSLLDETD